LDRVNYTTSPKPAYAGHEKIFSPFRETYSFNLQDKTAFATFLHRNAAKASRYVSRPRISTWRYSYHNTRHQRTAFPARASAPAVFPLKSIGECPHKNNLTYLKRAHSSPAHILASHHNV
jgi:hypothetical protein